MYSMAADFAPALIKWYHRHKRDLPWRHTRDPYKVWLSEIILQQTRVDQGLEYYKRFVKLFPNLARLAAASGQQVLKAWEGLGYYSRARNLHHTAREIQNEHSGQFPSTYAQLLKLKGIGPYTAAAIASFCFDEAVPVVDGNVIRVLSRLWGVIEPVDSVKGRKQINELAQQVMSTKKPAEYNQAIMEFGALHCTPRNPGCLNCPFGQWCTAKAKGLQTTLPLKERQTSIKQLFMYYFVVSSRAGMILQKRPDKGIWRGLYELPLIESDRALKPHQISRHFHEQFPFAASGKMEFRIEPVVHMLSHRKLIIQFVEVKVAMNKRSLGGEGILVKGSEWMKYPMPRPLVRFLHNLNQR